MYIGIYQLYIASHNSIYLIWNRQKTKITFALKIKLNPPEYFWIPFKYVLEYRISSKIVIFIHEIFQYST